MWIKPEDKIIYLRLVKNERLLLITLAGINFTYIMDFMIMMPLGPQFKRIFDIGPSTWSAVISSYTFAAAFSGIIAVFFLDFADRRKALLFMYAGFILATVNVGFAHSIEHLFIARSVAGLFGGILGALVLAIVGDIIPNERRGTAVGIIMTGFSAAASLGVPIGLFLGTKFGWEVAFFMIAGLSAVLFAMAWKVVPPVREHLDAPGSVAQRSWAGVKSVYTDPNQLLALMFVVLIIFGQFSIIPFISPYMVANVGFEEIQLTYIYLTGGILTVFSSPLFGRVADRFGRYQTFGVLMLISLIPIFAITHMGPRPIWFVLLFSSLFFVFAAGRMIPASAIVIGTAHPKHRGTFMSVRSSVVSLAQSIAAYCAGIIIWEGAHGQLHNFTIVGYIGIGTSILSYFVLRKIKDVY